MKFGDTLRERSIPQWSYREFSTRSSVVSADAYCVSDIPDNVDYDDLKQAIKRHTTGLGNHPRYIPGTGRKTDALEGFEDGLYTQLVKEHERVDLFVRSKAGELTRRLGKYSMKCECS